MNIMKNIWNITSSDQFRTIDDLIERSSPNPNYYALLMLSSLVITAGALTNNTAVLIGGMLITPLLTPILVIALGITAGQPKVSGNSFRLVIQSLGFVILGALVLGLLFGGPEETPLLGTTMRDTMLYLIIAVSSGIAATYAWIKKEASEALPGVAVAVSLVPPAAYIGVGLGTFDFGMAQSFFIVLAINVLGIIGGSMFVFSQFGFYRARGLVGLKSEEQKQELEEANKDPEEEAEKLQEVLDSENKLDKKDTEEMGVIVEEMRKDKE